MHRHDLSPGDMFVLKWDYKVLDTIDYKGYKTTWAYVYLDYRYNVKTLYHEHRFINPEGHVIVANFIDDDVIVVSRLEDSMEHMEHMEGTHDDR